MPKTQTETPLGRKRRPTDLQLREAAETGDWWVCADCSYVETQKLTRCSLCGHEHESGYQFKKLEEVPERGEYQFRAKEIAGAVEDLVRIIVAATSGAASDDVHEKVVATRRVLANQIESMADALLIDAEHGRE